MYYRHGLLIKYYRFVFLLPEYLPCPWRAPDFLPFYSPQSLFDPVQHSLVFLSMCEGIIWWCAVWRRVWDRGPKQMNQGWIKRDTHCAREAHNMTPDLNTHLTSPSLCVSQTHTDTYSSKLQLQIIVSPFWVPHCATNCRNRPSVHVLNNKSSWTIEYYSEWLW